MKSLHNLRSTAMLLTLATGACIASALVPLKSAQAETTDIHDIFSPSIRKLASGCQCQSGMNVFDPLFTVCYTNGKVTGAHSGCY